MVQALVRGIEKQGHDITVINGKTDTDVSLTPFNYIVIGVQKSGLITKKAPEGLSSFLENAGMVSGKRCYAFTLKHGIASGRFLLSIMKTMESEGMYLKKSDVISNSAEAEAVGSRLHIDRGK